jgi:pimeloyl-ACP methyl ester carboxylesterase
MYVPRAISAGRKPDRILLAVHGTDRVNQQVRDLFSDFAESTNTLVVAPLFPAGLGHDYELDDYKLLSVGSLRFDRIALAMVEEVAARYAVDASRFMLFGFSGGAHFAHRFFYAHPGRLGAVAVGAPGSVTLPQSNRSWWVGLADFASIFGHEPDWPAIRQVPIHLIVGRADTDLSEIIQSPVDSYWMDGADAAGKNRVERLGTLYRQLSALQCQVTFELLDGVSHELEPIAQAADRFFRQQLAAGCTALQVPRMP